MEKQTGFSLHLYAYNHGKDLYHKHTNVLADYTLDLTSIIIAQSSTNRPLTIL
jgi:hypothetical protein